MSDFFAAVLEFIVETLLPPYGTKKKNSNNSSADDEGNDAKVDHDQQKARH